MLVWGAWRRRFRLRHGRSRLSGRGASACCSAWPRAIPKDRPASSHHWSRELQAIGHTVRLMPPAYVKPYVKRQKNDMADAEAICEAVTRANMRFVPTKTPEQQSCLMLHRTRHLFIRQQTAVINSIRAHLAEFGIVAPVGRKRFRFVGAGRHQRRPSSAQGGTACASPRSIETRTGGAARGRRRGGSRLQRPASSDRGCWPHPAGRRADHLGRPRRPGRRGCRRGARATGNRDGGGEPSLTHKTRMRERLAEARLPQPRFGSARTLEEAQGVLPEIGLPAVLEPADSGGQRGVFRLETNANLSPTSPPRWPSHPPAKPSSSSTSTARR